MSVSADGRWVTFLRSASGSDPLTNLWAVDVAASTERLLADATALLGDLDDADLPDAERVRRERARESAGGIVGYAADPAGTTLAFALAGRPWLVDVVTGDVTSLATDHAVFDPRPDPGGSRVGYVADRALRAVGPGYDDREVVGEGAETVSWGSAEFIAAEEMGRQRGFWWSPDGSRLAVTRVDNAPVGTWYLSDPADPAAPARAVRYPAAGTANAVVGLYLVAPDGGEAVPLRWDSARLPYLADVVWTEDRPLTLVVQSRHQRCLQVLAADPGTGETSVLASVEDDVWVELVSGAPCWWDGRLVTVADHGGTRRLLVDGEPASPEDLWVRSVVGEGADGLVFTASGPDPTQVHVYAVDAGGACRPLTAGPGVHGAAVGGPTVVVTSASLHADGSRSVVHHGGSAVHTIANLSETPSIAPVVTMLESGQRAIRTAVLFPGGREPAAEDHLPVLLDPYGGPHAQRVLQSRAAFTVSQWFADQGFAVVVADGRGTPGRPGGWERSVWGDLAGPVLEDQVTALAEVASRYQGLDLGRVAIRGWSFGGFLAALAVLRRPDSFHAAVAGAPVTDWRLYDTHYTERYLGHPDEHPEHYERSGLLGDAPGLRRPLLLLHGLADDNVVVAHTLRLSRALLEAGRAHDVLPLSGVTHMTPQDVVAENLLLVEVAFLRRALGLSDS